MFLSRGLSYYVKIDRDKVMPLYVSACSSCGFKNAVTIVFLSFVEKLDIGKLNKEVMLHFVGH